MKKQPTRGTGDPKSPDDPEQSKRFEEAAREIDGAQAGEAFEAAITVVISPPAQRRNASTDPKTGKTSRRPSGGV